MAVMRSHPEARSCFEVSTALRPLALLAAAAAACGGGGYTVLEPCPVLSVTGSTGHRVNGSILSASLHFRFAGHVVICHPVMSAGQDTKSEHMTSLPFAWPCPLPIYAACLSTYTSTSCTQPNVCSLLLSSAFPFCLLRQSL